MGTNRPRRRTAVSIVTLLVAAATATAAAPPSPSADRATAAVPAPTLRADVSLVGGADGLERPATARDVVDHILAAASERRSLTVQDVMRSHAERLGLVPAGSTPTASSDDASAAATSDEQPPPTDVIPYPTGDLDGDGVGDVYVVVLGPVSTRVEARRGVDGDLLWSHDAGEVEDLLPIPVGDLDGDGTTDLLIWTFVGTESSDWQEGPDGVEFRYGYTGEWRFGIASGADGATRWVERVPATYDARYRETVTPTGREIEQTVAGTNSWLAPWAGGDLDGDGAGDIVLETARHLEGRFVWTRTGAGSVPAARHVRTEELEQSSAITLLAADGAVIRDLATSSGSTGISVQAVDDLTGDGTPDALLLENTFGLHQYDCLLAAGVPRTCVRDERTRQPRERLVAVAGTGTTLWEVDLGDSDAWATALGDVDGDGGTDLAVVDWATGTGTVRSGVDGRVRWSLPDRLLAVAPTGDVDADGEPDVVALRADGNDAPGRTTVLVERYAGRDGAAGAVSRHHTTYDPASDGLWVIVGLWSDRELDGAAGSDLAVTVVAADDHGQRGTATFERGRDGASLAAIDAGDGLLLDVVDLTGDGTDEGLVAAAPALGECTDGMHVGHVCPVDEAALRAVTVPDLVMLWEHRPPEDVLWSALWAVGDLDGHPGSELLDEWLLSGPDAEGYIGGFALRNGADLGYRWGAGAGAG